MLLKRALIHAALAFALVLGQQATWAHAISHLGKVPDSQQKHLPHTKVCDRCAFSAQFGNALVGKVVSFEPGAAAASRVPHIPLGFVPPTVRAFSSRAPPVSL